MMILPQKITLLTGPVHLFVVVCLFVAKYMYSHIILIILAVYWYAQGLQLKLGWHEWGLHSTNTLACFQNSKAWQDKSLGVSYPPLICGQIMLLKHIHQVSVATITDLPCRACATLALSFSPHVKMTVLTVMQCHVPVKGVNKVGIGF